MKTLVCSRFFSIAPPSVMMKANYRNTTEQGKDWDKINENRPAMSRSEGGVNNA
jgi:hypothetical protein